MSRETSSVVRMQEREPSSTEAEQALLGILLLDASRCGAVTGAGGAGLFFDPLHAEIFGAIRSRSARGDLVSPVTIADAMRSNPAWEGVGGVGYLARLAG